MGTATGLVPEEAWALVSLLPAASRRRARSALAALVAFADGHGVATRPEHLLDAEVIEAFCVQGLAGHSSSTRGTYRCVLSRLGEAAGQAPARRRTPFGPARAPAPYSPAERDELVAVAAAQRDATRRVSALALLAGSIGAGLRPRELVSLRGGDVVAEGGGVVVVVAGPPARAVPVSSPHGPRLLALARAAGEGFVFRPGEADRTYKNFVNDFRRRLVGDPGAPRLSVGRGRASFLCDHLAMGTPLAGLCAMAGIAEVESLARYALHVPGAPEGKAALRAALAAEERR